MIPKKIIVKDQDGGYIVGEFKGMTTNNIPIYEYVEYYHTLDSAVRSIK